jgi:hypothetical protein
VEARSLQVGDALKTRSSRATVITGLSSRQETAEVYCLDVEGCHSFAVTRAGILVHNKGSSEGTKGLQQLEAVQVSVYGKVTLKHFEVSILGASSASPLLDWLNRNGYAVNPSAREVLGTYIDENWAFVALKLNPSEKRHYHNEFLPPLTIRYRHARLIFPLRISSVSTKGVARITLYVLAESTVSSLNFPTTTLPFRYSDISNSKRASPEAYLESAIRSSVGKDARGLVVLWEGVFPEGTSIAHPTLRALIRSMFPLEMESRICLTRLEMRMDQAAMTDDVLLTLDSAPRDYFLVLQQRQD